MKKYILILILINSAIGGIQYTNKYNIGGVVGKYLAQSPYVDGNVLGVTAQYMLNKSSGLSVEFKSFKNIPNDQSDWLDSETIQMTSLYYTRYTGTRFFDSNVKLITSIGGANVLKGDNSKLYVMLGLGIRINVDDNLKIDLSFQDYMKEFRIPITGFPNVNIYGVGGGEHFLHMNLGISFGIGEKLLD